jgi:hypothetical protein
MSMIARIARFARSPQGRRLAREVAAYARSPEGKRRIEQARRQFANTRRPRPR